MKPTNKLLSSVINFMLDMLEIEYFYVCFVDGFYDHLISYFMSEEQRQKGRMMRNVIANHHLLIFKDDAYWDKAPTPYGYFGIIPIHYHKDMIGYFICSKSTVFTTKEKKIVKNAVQILEDHFAIEDRSKYCESDFRLCEVIRIFNSNLTLDKKLENVFDKIRNYFHIEAVVYVEDKEGYIPEHITKKESQQYQVSCKLRTHQIPRIKSILEEKKIRCIENEHIAEYIPEHILELFHMEEIVLFPLKNGGKVFGFIIFYGKNLRKLSSKRLDILEQVIIEIGASISTDMKWNQHISKVMDITILHDIIHRIQYEELDLEEVMDLILDAVPKLTGLKRCIIALKDTSEKYLIPQYANFQNALKDIIIPLEQNNGTDQRAIIAVGTKQPVVIYNPEEDNRCDSNWIKILGNYSSITIPLVSKKNTVVGVMFLDNEDFRIVKERQIEYYKILGKQLALIIGNSKLMKEIGNKVLKDGLLKIYNRQYIDQKYMELLRQYKQEKVPFTVMMIDLDHFKKVNDNFGHPYGDKVLKRVTEVIQKNIRGQDIIGRYGGEEIMVFLPGTPLDISLKVGERIRKAVESIKFDHNIRITLSIGIALCDEYAFMQENQQYNIIQLADIALYQAKKTGRNTICVYDGWNMAN